MPLSKSINFPNLDEKKFLLKAALRIKNLGFMYKLEKKLLF